MLPKPSQSALTGARQKQFPIRCNECGAREVRPATVAYEVDRNHDGRFYHVRVPHLRVNKCSQCGEVYMNVDSDRQIVAALREQLRLLTPEQIRENLAALRISQKEFAERLGVAAETVSRWLSGAIIQCRALDNLMRTYFGVAEARKHLTGEDQDPDFGTRVVQPNYVN
jgi:DNA-binding transcriptional regulator YiaG